MNRRYRLLAVLGTGLGLVFAGALAQAHPHAWIDLEITLERDHQGRITHMLHRWRFDPTYGQYLYDDAQEHQEGTTSQARLQGLADEILDNLEEYDWYSHPVAGDREIGVRAAGSPAMHMAEDLLFFRFRLALEEPVDASAEPLQYKVYDPTYFIEVLHEQPVGTRIVEPDGRAARHCRAELERPRPDPSLVARAMALDYGTNVDYDLGRYFAEIVTVVCEPEASGPR
jgi:ABC-type uncharacterized transport system substrate-binding protein